MSWRELKCGRNLHDVRINLAWAKWQCHLRHEI